MYVISLSHYFDYHGNMKNAQAIQAFLALGQESRLNVYRLIVQKGDTGLMPSQILSYPAGIL